ncbi:GntR family transcriptional regulator [Mycobacterium sp. MYCO198283]|uniref:GntR family transcriptional regulator n=1 Tax=Mycobacterium sp. MYCO198283 TaxID=2883505 RepID=UPI001E34E955|nr:GntR family transcriptional regulator [Mycobacterium sp. MYCO198283]MCG5430820.1 GntR family transcriptional regulator [Mycobacterium sp. MYCO198283]
MSEFGQWLRIDPDASNPPFDQLRTAIIDAVRDGRLPAGTRLPTVRELAAQAQVAVNTVARAYRELEAAGVVETRGRLGTFVAAADPAEHTMAEAARVFADTARALGLRREDAIRYLDAAFG